MGGTLGREIAPFLSGQPAAAAHSEVSPAEEDIGEQVLFRRKNALCHFYHAEKGGDPHIGPSGILVLKKSISISPTIE